jgi:YjbE family integral membrane protein
VPFSSELIPRILQIILIDLVLSGDNAVVIGMAAHPLPRRQRRIAIVIGGGGAIALRITLTALAAILLGLPLVKAIGGLLLLWIAVKLLHENEDGQGPTKVASTMRGAIVTILLADFVMSLDNVLGVAAASNGDVGLLLFGLIVSMSILMLGGSIVAELIDRLWWLAYLGALVIAWTGIDMVQEDELIKQVLSLPLAGQLLVDALVSVAVVLIGHRVHRRPLVARQSAQ